MSRIVAVGLVAAMLGGCAAEPPPRQLAAAAPECIALDQVIARRAVAPAAVEFEMIGGRIYRNQLASACPGLERLGDLAVVAITSGAEGSSLCRGDRVRIFDPVEARATGLQSYPECLLGDFVAVPRQ